MEGNLKLEETLKKEKPKKVSFVKNFVWQTRNISTAVNTLVLGYVTIYCTDTLGLSAALVGVLLMSSKIFDGFATVVAGYIVDRTNTKLGRARPYEFAIIGLWLCTWLLYSCPQEFSLVAKSVWIFVMFCFVTGVFNTLLSANGNVYMVRAFSSQEEYVKLTSVGGMLIFVAAIATNLTFPILMAKYAVSSHGWSNLVAIYAIPLALIGILRFFIIKEVNNVDVNVNPDEKLKIKDFINAMKDNKYVFIIAFMTFVGSFISNMGVIIYYYKYIFKDIAMAGTMSMIGIVVIPSLMLIPPLLKKFSVVKITLAGILVMMVGYLINFFAKDNIAMLMIGSLLTGVGNVPISMMSALLMIECSDYNEWKGKPRLEGTISSLIGFGNQVGAAFGTGMLGVLLTVSGYDGAAINQSSSSIMMIRSLYSLIPMGLFVIVFLVLRMYKLDELLPQIRKDNEERRNKIAEAEQV